ncbi:DUF192 domain-containing protein [Cognatishimia sp. WU-CL00825]|uniref:DUF192 domain-containing protein n=1 Tax=Cognatishimia sp. WU-CL00825 TaxID=3127658 RepID=UPI00310547E1
MFQRLRRLRAFGLAAILSSLAVTAFAQCRNDTVHLRGDWGKARFSVEVANNAAQRTQGLMGRQTLPKASGMLFVFHRSRNLAFWMRNTFVPLDIIYLNESGTVVNIAHNTVPLDETPLPSAGPARYVLEINAGLSKALGIAPGTQLRHPAVLQHKAAWSCRDPL